MGRFHTVAGIAEVPPGEGRAFEVGERIVAIFNDHGTFRAIDDMCPHMGASLAGGHFENGEVSCPWHAWRFDVKDGSWCENRRLKIDVFEVRIVDDEIQVNVDDAGEPIISVVASEDSLGSSLTSNVYEIATQPVKPKPKDPPKDPPGAERNDSKLE